MRFAFACVFLFLTACKGIDVVPDEFRVDYGTGSSRNNFDHRNTDFQTDTEWVSFGVTWYLGRSYIEDSLDREMKRGDELYRMMLEDSHKREAVPMPAAAPTPTIVTTPAPVIHVEVPDHDEAIPKADPFQTGGPRSTPVTITDFGGAASQYLLYAFGALALTIAAVVKRKFLIKGTVHMVDNAKRRMRRDPGQHGERSKPPHDPKSP